MGIKYRLVKEFADRIFGLLLLMLLSPLLGTIYLLVLVSMGRPVIYKGVRTGWMGKEFHILKFRTMLIDSEKTGHTTAKNDPRVTALGAILRRYKLDELTQLFNVVRGEMSFVGPRPEMPVITRMYTQEETTILSVKPGITDISCLKFYSLDQIVGSENADQVYEEIVLGEKNRLRLKYVRRVSLVTDLNILLATVNIFLGKVFGLR